MTTKLDLDFSNIPPLGHGFSLWGINKALSYLKM